ncbi:HPr-rel-A system PqqD family peptide chaperone [Thiocapsa rosea]|uniref:PqqD family protein of HPr-rel-A system n=1 Tax=Thiocapsa rosea TaxID=69360 RepID=A0A495VGB5_9GAMM|nr:HPr-rel-A system PqqD family peptide chaperone [Thiocapsa rosea]RKT47485.1 PqqD family protein of HPr-rel-A system [Thiocapsa rosea]
MSTVGVSPKTGLTCRDLDGELIVLDASGGFVHQLNPTGALIWALLDQGVSVPAIADRLAETFELDATNVDQDVKRFIADLERVGLLENSTSGESVNGPG